MMAARMNKFAEQEIKNGRKAQISKQL